MRFARFSPALPDLTIMARETSGFGRFPIPMASRCHKPSTIAHDGPGNARQAAHVLELRVAD